MIGHVPAGWFPFSCPTAALCWRGFQKAGEGPPAMADAELHLLFPCRPLISKRSRPYHSQWGFAEEVPSGPGTQDLAAALLPPPGGGGGPQEQRLPRSVLGPHLTFQDRERSGPTGRGRPPPEALEGQRLGSEPASSRGTSEPQGRAVGPGSPHPSAALRGPSRELGAPGRGGRRCHRGPRGFPFALCASSADGGRREFPLTGSLRITTSPLPRETVLFLWFNSLMCDPAAVSPHGG